MVFPLSPELASKEDAERLHNCISTEVQVEEGASLRISQRTEEDVCLEDLLVIKAVSPNCTLVEPV